MKLLGFLLKKGQYNSMKQACPSSDFLTLVMNKYLQTLVK